MYNVLIVEDEMLVRVGIKASIDWEKHGMQIVGDAVDGRSGLQLFKDRKPDILITDINLPRLNGVELIKEAHAINPNCAIIVISCVDDFTILRKLIPYNLVDYLLKSSICTVDIEATLVKAKERLDQLDINRQELILEELNTSKKLKQYILTSNNTTNEEMLVLDHTGYSSYILCLYISGVHNNIHVIFKTIVELLIKYYKPYTPLIMIHRDDAKIMVVLEKEDLALDTIRKQLISFQKYVYKALNVSVFCCIEDYKNDYTSMKRLFYQFYGYIEHIKISCQQVEENYIGRKHKEIKAYVELTITMLDGYLTRHEQGSHYLVNEEEEYQHEQVYDFLAFRELTNRKFQVIQQVYPIFSQEVLGTYQESVEAAKHYIDIFRIYRHLLFSTNNLRLSPISMKPEVMHVLQYISEVYDKHITIEELAHNVALSPNYLSCIFKKDMSLSIVDYLTRYRVYKSMELLEQTDDYLYEVADKTGFTNESYFSKTFKKVTSFSPARWRKLMKVTHCRS